MIYCFFALENSGYIEVYDKDINQIRNPAFGVVDGGRC